MGGGSGSTKNLRMLNYREFGHPGNTVCCSTNLQNQARIEVSKICYGAGYSVTNLGNLDRIRQDQGWLAEGDFP